MNLVWVITIVITFISAFYLGGRFYCWLENDDETASLHRVIIPVAIAGIVVCLYLAVTV